MLQIREISVVFGATEVLQAVSFGIGPGDGVALVGANGAGKTTLLRCLMGQMRPDAGEVVVNFGVKRAYLAQDEEVQFEGTAIERALSFEPDLLTLYRGIQAERYELIQDYSDRGGYMIEDLIRTCAENFGVADVLDTSYEYLSRGMRRKVDLVGMFSAEADLMVFDEPINFLDK